MLGHSFPTRRSSDLADRPLYTLLADNIANRASDTALIGLNAQNLAGLLDGLSEAGFAEASAKKDEWQMEWWRQADYLADMLRREAHDLKSESQAIEELARQIGRAK